MVRYISILACNTVSRFALCEIRNGWLITEGVWVGGGGSTKREVVDQVNCPTHSGKKSRKSPNHAERGPQIVLE